MGLGRGPLRRRLAPTVPSPTMGEGGVTVHDAFQVLPQFGLGGDAMPDIERPPGGLQNYQGRLPNLILPGKRLPAVIYTSTWRSALCLAAFGTLPWVADAAVGSTTLGTRGMRG
jgi:hypothetical protein